MLSLINGYFQKYVRKLGHYNQSTEEREQYFFNEENICPKRQLKTSLRGNRKISGKYVVADFHKRRRIQGKGKEGDAQRSTAQNPRLAMWIRSLV